MLEAELPQNENERLDLLYGLNILDTPVEERFDRITRLVCNILDVPIAAISLVDEHRQWFKSIQGLKATETERRVAFCAHAILDEGLMLVSDATKDVRFLDNPLVTGDPNIRFYAGQPLSLVPNMRLGTLCAIDSKTRELTKREADIMRDLGRMVESELQLLFLASSQRKRIVSFENVELDMMVDPVTRLWSRKGTLEMLEREWDWACDGGEDIAFACVGLYQLTNDMKPEESYRFDEAITVASQTISRALGVNDLIGRWSDNQFILVFHGYGATGLNHMMQSIQKELECPFFLEDGTSVSLKIRAGAFGMTANKEDRVERLTLMMNQEYEKTSLEMLPISVNHASIVWR